MKVNEPCQISQIIRARATNRLCFPSQRPPGWPLWRGGGMQGKLECCQGRTDDRRPHHYPTSVARLTSWKWFSHTLSLFFSSTFRGHFPYFMRFGEIHWLKHLRKWEVVTGLECRSSKFKNPESFVLYCLPALWVPWFQGPWRSFCCLTAGRGVNSPTRASYS